MRQFKSAATAAMTVDNPVDVEFEVDGRVLTASPPSSGQLALFMAAYSGGSPPDIAKGVLELFESILDEGDYEWVVEGLRAGTLAMEVLMEVVEYLGEEWSARPTSSASVSSPSRVSTGRASTAKRATRAKTRST